MRQHGDEAEIRATGERGRQYRGDLLRPQVLVLEVDQVAGSADGLDVGPGHAAFPVGCEGVAAEPPRVCAQDLHGVGAGDGRVRQLRREWVARRTVAPSAVFQGSEGRPAEQLWVLPALAEDGLDIAHGGPLDGQLHVVPRRGRPVDLGHGLPLRVSVVPAVVAPAVTQVDAPQEGDVPLRLPAVA